ncbi:MAG TPA: cytochrome c [Acidobacteriaceae bacterium]|jgi:cytochrome c6|nr:cytochrome c [Acidobacteriaceae bacterium]
MKNRSTKNTIVLLTLFSASIPCLAQSAADLYTSKCQMCHSADGSATTPAGKMLKARAFNSAEAMKESDVDLLAVINNGKNKMPAFAGKLTPAQMTDLVAYVHTLQKK